MIAMEVEPRSTLSGHRRAGTLHTRPPRPARRARALLPESTRPTTRHDTTASRAAPTPPFVLALALARSSTSMRRPPDFEKFMVMS